MTPGAECDLQALAEAIFYFREGCGPPASSLIDADRAALELLLRHGSLAFKELRKRREDDRISAAIHPVHRALALLDSVNCIGPLGERYTISHSGAPHGGVLLT